MFSNEHMWKKILGYYLFLRLSNKIKIKVVGLLQCSKTRTKIRLLYNPTHNVVVGQVESHLSHSQVLGECKVYLGSSTFGINEFDTLRPSQNGRYFTDDTFSRIFVNENVRISINFRLNLPKDPINNIPALVQIMAWRRPGDKPLSEPMMIT